MFSRGARVMMPVVARGVSQQVGRRALSSGARASRRSVADGAVKVVAGVATGLGVLALNSETTQASDALHPPQYPWPFTGWTDSFDAAAIRRGHQVFKEVCASCHSLDRIAFRNLVGVAYTEEEAKELAAEIEVDDIDDETGEPIKRPGKLADYFPRPYKNEIQARLANDGALPPDLSLIIKARHDGANYVFALLTGYPTEHEGLVDIPAGVELREGLHYNPYFPGGAIGMAQNLFDEVVEYEDGTVCTASQAARDVVAFLSFCAEPEHDERKRMGIKALVTLSLLAGATFYWKRLKWATVKSGATFARKVAKK